MEALGGPLNYVTDCAGLNFKLGGRIGLGGFCRIRNDPDPFWIKVTSVLGVCQWTRTEGRD